MAWRLAGSPTRRSPLSVKATTLGVRRLPSWVAITLTSPPSITATTEFVVPRSMPMIFSPEATGMLLSGRHEQRRPLEARAFGYPSHGPRVIGPGCLSIDAKQAVMVHSSAWYLNQEGKQVPCH